MQLMGGQIDRRRHRRFSVGVPVRLRMKGSAMSTMIELSDVSFHGCRMRSLSNAGAPALNARVDTPRREIVRKELFRAQQELTKPKTRLSA